MKITKNKKIFLLMLLLFSKTFSVENTKPSINIKDFEDSFIEVKAKKLTDNFFMVKYNYESNQIFVGINSLIYFLELYSLNVDTENKIISGEIGNKKVNVKLNCTDCFVLDDDLYVSLEVLKNCLCFKEAKFNFSTLILTLEPNFTLPYEEREESKIARMKLDGERESVYSEYDYEMPRKLITPGVFKISYNEYDLEKSDYHLNYEYASQLLYGEFYLQGKIKPEEKIDFGSLTYSDIVGENDLTFGHFYMDTPRFLGVNSHVIGVSFDNEETYMTKDGGMTVIKGTARNAETIELYRGSFLVDYIKPVSENFEFKIDDGFLSSDYNLKIYYNSGEIEQRKVYSIADRDLLKKGKSRVTLQAGKTREGHFSEYLGRGFYGVSDNLTLGIGAMDLISRNGKRHKIIENDFLFRNSSTNYPSLLTFKNYYNHEKEENSYEAEYEQKIKDYYLKFTENKYSDYSLEKYSTKKYDSASIGKNFNRNSFEFGVERDEKKASYYKGSNVEKNVYGIWHSQSFRPFYTTLKVEKNIDGARKDISYEPTITYSTSNGVSFILDGEITKYDNIDRYTQEYSLRVNLRQQDLIKDTLMFDVGAEVRYSNITEKFRYGFNFSLELDDIIYTKLSSRTSINEHKDRDTRNSIEVSKIIDLSNPTRKIKKNVSLNSSWIHGKIFWDKNGNGIFDGIDEPLQNVKIIANLSPFYSDKNGNYVADGFYNNDTVTLKVDRKSLDPMLKNTKGDLRIKTRKSSSGEVNIAVETVSVIMGNIMCTEDFNEREFMKKMSMTNVILEKDGKIIKEIKPDFDGMYMFEDVPPGKYNIKFEYLGKSKVSFSKNIIPIDVTLTDPSEGEYFEGYDTSLIKNN